MIYSSRKRYQLGYGNESPSPILKKHLEEIKMACDNIDCSCEGCTCDPCTCTPEDLCGCNEKETAQRKSRPTGRITNEWKGLV